MPTSSLYHKNSVYLNLGTQYLSIINEYPYVFLDGYNMLLLLDLVAHTVKPLI